MVKFVMFVLLSCCLFVSQSYGDDFYIVEGRDKELQGEQDFFAAESESAKPVQTEVKESSGQYKPAEMIKKLGYATGTGFFVSPEGHLITNHHVVEDAVSVKVKIDDSLAEAEVLATDPANDIALLRVPGLRVESPLQILKNSEAEVGQEVMAIGYPLVSLQGQNQKATFGRINSKYGMMDDVRFFQIDVPIQPGNSGGPILTRTGAVVGVATMTLSSVAAMKQTGTLPQNINYGVKIDYAFPLLDEFDVEYMVSSATGSLEFSDVTKQSRNSVVLVIAQGQEENK